MKKIILLISLFIITNVLLPQSIDFITLMENSERNPNMVIEARKLAGLQNLPVLIYVKDKAFIEARGIENEKIVYTVIRDFYHPFNNGSTGFIENISLEYDLTRARLIYNNGNIVDNSGEEIVYNISPRTSIISMLLVMDSYNNKVIGLDTQTGDIIDTSFIPRQDTMLATPKVAMQTPLGKIFISDQIKDVVYEFDTAGTFIQIFAPQGGQNNSILDNIRGIGFRPNNNLLVTVGSGANTNTLQQFSSSGSHIGTFISNPSLTSPFDVIYVDNKYYVTSSTTSASAVKIGIFDSTGAYIGPFTTRDSTRFCQQIIKLDDGNFAVAAFSIPGVGIQIFSPNGTFIKVLTGVSNNRGVYQLGNGNFVTTNATGLYEIDDTTGALVRTIISGASVFSGQYITKYVPGPVTGISGNNTAIDDFKLMQNYPNPFNPVTKIYFEIPKQSKVKLTVFDVLGREIKTIVNTDLTAGSYNYEFDAGNISSGVYFYKLQAGDYTAVRKMMLLR
ncbi:MAG: T9SS type A sorting domain-containing protein [Ignavibacteria bacterium]|nr:T9SS type A sorting domain-containing protein [Ignavibacteria bacterium]